MECLLEMGRKYLSEFVLTPLESLEERVYLSFFFLLYMGFEP